MRVFTTNGKSPTRLAFLADLARRKSDGGNCPKFLAQSTQGAPRREDVIPHEETLSSRISMLILTLASIPRYTARMPIQFILPKKFTRAQIEWRMDELALQFQGTKDKKIIAQITALNRLLAKMDARDSSKAKNRQ